MEIYWIILHFSCIQYYYSSLYFPCVCLWELSCSNIYLQCTSSLYQGSISTWYQSYNLCMVSYHKVVQVQKIWESICFIYKSTSSLLFLSEEELVLSLQYFLLVLFVQVVESIFLRTSTSQCGFFLSYDLDFLQLSRLESQNWHSIAQ